MTDKSPPGQVGVEPTRPRRRTSDLHAYDHERGPQPGTHYVRITRLHTDKLRRVRKNLLRATERAFEPEAGFERWWYKAKRFLFGRPLASEEAQHERLSKKKALAVFASDALSSSAYATEEILLVLVAAGTSALTYSIPIAVAIVALLAVVSFSYRQTIRAYPQGGGSYIVTKDNLGTVPSLVAAAALMIDYTLTVAVSVSAGVAAITSAWPSLQPLSVELGVLFIALITIGNLRGVSESGSIFAIPTYFFIGAMFLTLAVAAYGLATGTLGPVATTEAVQVAAEPLTLFLLLRAFASGCAALTGVEAISDGVPAFKPVEWKNAQITLTAMALILGVLFFGITLVAHALEIVPSETETVISQIAHAVWDSSPIYLVVQIATMLILVLAANTAFADFPRLNYFLARDDFMPHQFQNRGDRLAFSVGICVLALLATLLLVAFGASVSGLIPLYAVGVFISFTLSQASVAVRWWRLREPGWSTSLPINVLGALTTGIVAIIIAVTKFEHGAWVVLLLIPTLVALMLGIRRHYRTVDEELRLGPDSFPLPEPREQVVLVPISKLNQAAIAALTFARSISQDVRAVHITDDPDGAAGLRSEWQQLDTDVPLVILETPYRSISGPLMAYIEALDAQDEEVDLPITVVLPEFVPRRWWEWFLHNQQALRLRTRLFFRPNTVVVSVPYHLHR